MLRVFFDIDGTLLLTDGAGRSALRSAMERVYGTSGPLDGYHFHGKTDPQIVLELMGAVGLEVGYVRGLMASMWPVYLERLRTELELRRAAARIIVLPGVAKLLATLESEAGVSLGLLTGNIEEAAVLKLEAAGVRSRFDVGAYGSDSETRSEIARIAVERSRLMSQHQREDLAHVVVGDTPEDIACARAVSAGAIAVATGRHGASELVEAGADVVFDDFRDTDAVVRSILMLRGVGASPEARGNGGSR
jgi:phosphoglycolate phosphatase-like HAD superfamily hydrolase